MHLHEYCVLCIVYIDVKIGDLYKLGIEQEVLIVTS